MVREPAINEVPTIDPSITNSVVDFRRVIFLKPIDQSTLFLAAENAISNTTKADKPYRTICYKGSTKWVRLHSIYVRYMVYLWVLEFWQTASLYATLTPVALDVADRPEPPKILTFSRLRSAILVLAFVYLTVSFVEPSIVYTGDTGEVDFESIPRIAELISQGCLATDTVRYDGIEERVIEYAPKLTPECAVALRSDRIAPGVKLARTKPMVGFNDKLYPTQGDDPTCFISATHNALKILLGSDSLMNPLILNEVGGVDGDSEDFKVMAEKIASEVYGVSGGPTTTPKSEKLASSLDIRGVNGLSAELLSNLEGFGISSENYPSIVNAGDPYTTTHTLMTSVNVDYMSAEAEEMIRQMRERGIEYDYNLAGEQRTIKVPNFLARKGVGEFIKREIAGDGITSVSIVSLVVSSRSSHAFVTLGVEQVNGIDYVRMMESNGGVAADWLKAAVGNEVFRKEGIIYITPEALGDVLRDAIVLKRDRSAIIEHIPADQ